MEQLLFLVVVAVLSILHSWWKKSRGEGEEDTPAPQPGRPQQRPAAQNWEEELRRLLQGDDEPERPAPPPVIARPQRPAAPPPLPAATARRPQPAPPALFVDASAEAEGGLPMQMPTLKQNAQAFLRGNQMEQRVAEHMHGVRHQPAAVAQRASPVVNLAVSLLRDRQSQKAAVLSGIILGPPKALEE